MKKKKQVTKYWIKRQAEYRKLVSLTEYIKNDIAPIVARKALPPVGALKIRKKAVEFFRNKKFIAVCKKCKGRCCSDGGPYMDCLELIYLCIVNTDFSLPEPDWKFLELRAKVYNRGSIISRCLFLGPSGCLLGDNRPLTCLCSRCDQIDQVIEREKLDAEFLYDLRSPYYNWRRKIRLEKNQRLFHGPLIDIRVSYALRKPIEDLKEELRKELAI